LGLQKATLLLWNDRSSSQPVHSPIRAFGPWICTNQAEEAGNLCIQRQRCQWVGCYPATRKIRLKTLLTQQPRACLDSIVPHELADLRVASMVPNSLPCWMLANRTGSSGALSAIAPCLKADGMAAGLQSRLIACDLHSFAPMAQPGICPPGPPSPGQPP